MKRRIRIIGIVFLLVLLTCVCGCKSTAVSTGNPTASSDHPASVDTTLNIYDVNHDLIYSSTDEKPLNEIKIIVSELQPYVWDDGIEGFYPFNIYFDDQYVCSIDPDVLADDGYIYLETDADYDGQAYRVPTDSELGKYIREFLTRYTKS